MRTAAIAGGSVGFAVFLGLGLLAVWARRRRHRRLEEKSIYPVQYVDDPTVQRLRPIRKKVKTIPGRDEMSPPQLPGESARERESFLVATEGRMIDTASQPQDENMTGRMGRLETQLDRVLLLLAADAPPSYRG
jgi:hypothetical protein